MVELDHLFKNIFDVVESQIFQEKPGFAELLRIVKDINYSLRTEKKLINEIKEKLGDEKFNIIYLEKIPRKNGKIKFLINNYN